MDTTTYQLIVKNRDYSNWSIQTEKTTETKSESFAPMDSSEKGEHVLRMGVDEPIWKNKINPIQDKMFSNDIFIIENDKIKIIESEVKNKKEIPGVLVLENNKTFGRTNNKKRLFYKCIPNDKQLPIFLIPYEVKLGFLKVNKNKFVTFKFDNWDDKHPQGLLVQTLGNIDSLPVYYEYQLYCKELHISISTFINKTREQLEKKELDALMSQIHNHPNYIIEDRRETHQIITIDPDGCNDFDDAFSIQKIDDSTMEISIYIANVFFWLETFQLWDYLSERVSTIYLPDKRRPMLPTLLSENLCSLQMNKERFAFTLCLHIDKNGHILPDTIRIINTFIKVKTNYVYEDPVMLSKDEPYIQLMRMTQKLDDTIKDSHDLVSFWMIYMNSYCGNMLYQQKQGIFRESRILHKKDKQISHLSNSAKSFLNMWNNVSGNYSLYDEKKSITHEVMGIETYIHVTSPIRRLVDIINQTLLLKQCGLIKTCSENSCQFVSSWFHKIDKLNIDMKSIRRVQSDCDLVYRCFTTPEIIQREYRGVICEMIGEAKGRANLTGCEGLSKQSEKIQTNPSSLIPTTTPLDPLISQKGVLDNDFYSYTVYLEDIQLLSRITCNEVLDNYSVHTFKIYLFEDEDRIQKKIRLQKIESVKLE